MYEEECRAFEAPPETGTCRNSCGSRFRGCKSCDPGFEMRFEAPNSHLGAARDYQPCSYPNYLARVRLYPGWGPWACLLRLVQGRHHVFRIRHGERQAETVRAQLREKCRQCLKKHVWKSLRGCFAYLRGKLEWRPQGSKLLEQSSKLH